MVLSEKVANGVKRGLWISAMFAEGAALKREHGAENVFDLTVGNPVMEPPEEYNRELKVLASRPIPGIHRYTENAGTPEARDAITAQLVSDTGIPFTRNHVVITCGTGGALNAVLKTLLNPGEEVIALAPYFFEYEFLAGNYDGVLRIVSCNEQFMPDLNLLEATLGPKTKAVIVNSPNNPSGVVYNEDTLRGIADVLTRRARHFGTKIVAISDDVYSKLVYDGLRCPRMANYYSDTIIVTSFSKELSLPGERIGYMAVHPECAQVSDILDGLIFSNRVLGYMSAATTMQWLISRLVGITVPVAEYQKKRDFLYKALTESGYSVVKPGGAFYMLPRCPTEESSFMAEMKKALVLAVPGSPFGTPGHFRISYCLDDKTLRGAVEKLRKIVENSKRTCSKK